jgi:integrase
MKFFGKDKLVIEIHDDDVAKLVAWRRGHVSNGGRLISPWTVNHTTTTLRALFARCKLWGVRFAHEPKWSQHLLPVPVERVRELSDDEANRLDAVMRDDYAPFFAFAMATGWRLEECFLRWDEVNFGTRQITKLGKNGKRITRTITPSIREILWPLQDHHPEFVFTYVSQRREPGRGLIKGQRYPLTYNGLESYWRRLRQRASITGFRFHDIRHDVATKLLRATGNLRLVQKALGHASIKTTTRYAHVLDSEVAEAMEALAARRKKPAARLKVV